MTFDKEYYNTEVREGFLVPCIMKKAWAAQIEVLTRFDKICEKYGLHYWIDFGSLLGVIRHGGFIPWDDDIDMSMPRKDLEALRRILQSGETEFDAVDFYGEANFDSLLLRLVTRKEISFQDDTLLTYHGFPYVVGLDIFPVDNVPDSQSERKKFIEAINSVRKVLYVVRENLVNDRDLNILLDQLEETFKWRFDRERNIKNQIMQLLDHVFMMYNDQKCKEQAVIQDWAKKNYTYNTFSMDDIIEVPFENIKVKVPLIYDKMLQGQFKDYMRIVMESGCHDYPFFEKQRLFAVKGANISFEKRNIDINSIERQEFVKEKSDKKVGLEKFELVCKITTMIFKMIYLNKKDEIEEMLNNAQDMAIRMGAYLENNYRTEDIKEIITLLEQYCEAIYELGCRLDEDITSQQEVLTYLNTIIEGITIEFGNIPEESGLFKVLMIIGQGKYFNVYRPIYNQLNNRDGVKLIVLKVPYYYRDSKGVLTEDMALEDDLPEDVDFVDYDTFDCENTKVDVLITSYPYDEFDMAGSIPPIYYIANMQKNAKKIIYISPYEIDEIQSMDQKAAVNMNYYVKSPGIVKADIIATESNNMRNMYISALKDWAGEETHNIWENKVISVSEIPLLKMVREDLEELEVSSPEIRANNISKVMYYTNISVMAEYGEEHIQRIKERLKEIASEAGEENTVWGIDPAMKELNRLRKEIYGSFLSLKQEITTSTKILVVEDYDELQDIIFECKKYCGDSSFYANKMRVDLKEVSIEYIK